MANSIEWYNSERHTHVLLKGLIADNADQSKKQAPGSKEQSVELRNRFVSRHTSGEEFRKIFCFIEGSQKHVVSVTLNGRSLKQPGFFLELVSWLNWGIDATLHRSGLYGGVAKLNPLLSEDKRKHTWTFTKKHLKDPRTLRNKILWSDEHQF